MAGKRGVPARRASGPLRAVLYVRVSTEEQARDGTTSLDEQERKCREYAEHRGWEVTAVYREEGATGTTDDRPEWNRLMAAARAGEIGVVVFARWNRVARRVLIGLRIVEKLEAVGVDVAVVEHDLDTTTPIGRVVRVMLLAFAEMERDSLVAQMAAGQYSKARDGRWPTSRAGAPYGLRVEGAGREARLVLCDPEAATVRKAAGLLLDDREDLAGTARILNGLGMLPRKAAAWQPELLRAVMSRRALTGEVIWGKTGDCGDPVLIPGVPAVLSPGRWEAVQVAMTRKRTFECNQPRTYPLSLRMTSPCGDLYTGVIRSDIGLAQYRCRSTKWEPWDGWKSCGCVRLNAAETEDRVWDEITGLLSDPDRLRSMARDYLGLDGASLAGQASELEPLGRAIDQLRSRVSDGITRYIRAGIDPEALAGAMDQLQDELAALERRRDDVERHLADQAAGRRRLDRLDELAETAAHRLSDMGTDARTEVIALLDIRVVVLDAGSRPALRMTGEVSDAVLAEPDPGGTTVPARSLA